jgi:hypothetical protein
MPNPNNPFGFRPVIRSGGSPFSVTEYGKDPADVNPIYAFDLVGKLTGGTPPPLPENPNYTAPRVQSGTLLTPGTSLWLGASLSYGAPSKATFHPVTDELDVIYIAQSNATAANSTHAGLNANIVNAGGSALTKMSQMQIAGGGVAATAGLDLRLLRVAMITGNLAGPNAILECLISKHANAPGSAGS